MARKYTVTAKVNPLSFQSVIKPNTLYQCHSCRQLYYGRDLVCFAAFGVPDCVCKTCAENAVKSISDALGKTEND